MVLSPVPAHAICDTSINMLSNILSLTIINFMLSRQRAFFLHLAVLLSQPPQPLLTIRMGFNPLSKPFPQS